jgi:hypothetical protein
MLPSVSRLPYLKQRRNKECWTIHPADDLDDTEINELRVIATLQTPARQPSIGCHRATLL